MLRIGIIGLGGYSADHWQGLEEVQRRGACRIVATAVIDPERHAATLDRLRGEGVQVFGSAMEMFDAMRGKMDAVTIPTSIHTHAELMIAAVRSGYHVYLEKPPAATIQEVDEMIEAGRRAGKLCAVGFQMLWSQSMAMLKLRVSEGALGQVRTVACAAGWIRPDAYYARNDWAGRLRVGHAWVLDGPSNNALAHYITNILFLASPLRRRLALPVAVRAELYAGHDIESEDTSAIEIFTAEGARCYFLATQCADEVVEPEITLIGERGRAYRNHNGQVSIRYDDGRIEQPALDDSRMLVERFENFVAAASAGDVSMLQCHLEMVRPFTLAINGAFESSRRVERIHEDFIRHSGEGPSRKTIIDGLDSAISQGASQGKLFTDLGLPWARRTSTFDLTGYKRFPVQFQAGPAEMTQPKGNLF